MIRFADVEAAGSEIDLVAQVENIFSPQGLLSRARNFEYRAEQQAMAVAVAKALEDNQHLAVEAGTGVGKSLAYLVPAILFAVARKRKAIVSTHTINLQEQLTEKDLPMLSDALPVPFTFAMLKGRQNYLCTRRLARSLQQSESLFTSPEAAELRRIEEWARQTEDGSLSDFQIEPDAKVWQQVCSERGLCSPKLCGYHSDFAKEHPVCFFQRARRKIMGADVLILNHTLFFTLLGTVEEEKGPEGVLFRNDFVIFDEAHTLEGVASKHVGLSVSNGQIRFTLQRLWNPNTNKGLLATLRQGNAISLVNSLLDHTQQFFAEVEHQCEQLALATGQRALKSEAARDRGWTEMRIRKPDFVEDTITLGTQRLREAISDLIKTTEHKETGEELGECNRRLAELREALAAFISQEFSSYVYWVERSGKHRQNLALHAAPVDVANFLRPRLFGNSTSVVMTSATLGTRSESRSDQPSPPARTAQGKTAAANHPLGYFVSRIGAEAARLLQLGSPFDFQRQMKVYVVRRIPDPREAAYEEALARWIEEFIRKTHGKAIVLFTNMKLMHAMGARLQRFFEELGLQCLIQGTGTPRSLMLDKFKRDINSVLFGAESFWQGIDVPGEALSNVIITRLPFAVPDHPLIEARVESIEARGGNSFLEFSLPEAILKFRQGVGRLIRTKSDSGIVVVLDNRILTKRYGQAFLNAIPACQLEVI